MSINTTMQLSNRTNHIVATTNTSQNNPKQLNNKTNRIGVTTNTSQNNLNIFQKYLFENEKKNSGFFQKVGQQVNQLFDNHNKRVGELHNTKAKRILGLMITAAKVSLTVLPLLLAGNYVVVGIIGAMIIIPLIARAVVEIYCRVNWPITKGMTVEQIEVMQFKRQQFIQTYHNQLNSASRKVSWILHPLGNFLGAICLKIFHACQKRFPEDCYIHSFLEGCKFVGYHSLRFFTPTVIDEIEPLQCVIKKIEVIDHIRKWQEGRQNATIITYNLDELDKSTFPGISISDAKEDIQKAMEEWSLRANVEFVQVHEHAMIDIKGDHLPDSNNLGYAYFPRGGKSDHWLPTDWQETSWYSFGPHNTVTFQTDWAWTNGSFTDIATHELGHALGLQHSEDSNDIMYWQYDPFSDNVISHEDISKLNDAYEGTPETVMQEIYELVDLSYATSFHNVALPEFLR